MSAPRWLQGRCRYCDRMCFRRPSPGHLHLTIDHAVPLALGGSRWGSDNFVIACYECNSWKGCLTLEEFVAICPQGSMTSGVKRRDFGYVTKLAGIRAKGRISVLPNWLRLGRWPGEQASLEGL